ncbi:MAG: pabC [Rickettsiaceae bacterium]|jgi:branched-chain amino acid aminotransferase|nr:pabC [Rickettsiaceae bacterium]
MRRTDYVIINDKILPEKNALISIKDRGFRFGDGAFETCLIFDGVIYNWESHQKRLRAALKAIKIKFDDKNLLQNCQKLIQKNKTKNGYLRISVSRGVGSNGYSPLKNNQPTLVIEVLETKPKPKSPIKLSVSKIEKIPLQSLPVNYKLTQGMNSILAKMKAEENNCFDAVILNNKKQICETSSANIFWIKDDVLYTPHQDCGCVLGTIREKIIFLSPIKTRLAKAKLSKLLNADEAFITNAAIGVLHIDQIGKVKFKNKKYGKIFSDLLDQDIKNYAKKTKAKLA